MNNKTIISSVIFFLIIILIIFLIVKKNEQFTNKSMEPTIKGICAFDIDGTITHGIDRAAKAISKCRQLGAVIAINTARPGKFYGDLDLVSLGLTTQDLDDFYHGEPFTCSFTDIKCFENTIANTKIKHLFTLSSKWNVNPEKIILFDDQWSNISKAKEAGFSTIHANYHSGGLPENTEEQIENILNN